MLIVTCMLEKQKASLNPEDNTYVRQAIFTLILIWGVCLLAWVVENDRGSGFQWPNLYIKVYKLLGHLTTCGKKVILIHFDLLSENVPIFPQIERK